jgi:chemotaxis protein MotB
MKARGGWIVLLVCVLALSGCKSVHDAGFPHSRSWKLAQKLKAENEALSNRKAEADAKLAAIASRAQKAELELKQTKLALAKANKAGATVKTAAKSVSSRREKIAQLVRFTGGTPIVTPEGQMGVRLAGDILFKSGKTAVTGGKDTLQRIANAIQTLGGDVIVFVDGHTDSDPLIRTKHLYKDNYGLGAARANSVAKALEVMGVARGTLVTRSFGQDKPLAANKTRAGKSQNRRVEIMFALREDATATKTSMNR